MCSSFVYFIQSQSSCLLICFDQNSGFLFANPVFSLGWQKKEAHVYHLLSFSALLSIHRSFSFPSSELLAGMNGW